MTTGFEGEAERRRIYDAGRCAEHSAAVGELRSIFKTTSEKHNELSERMSRIDVTVETHEKRFDRFEDDVWKAVDKIREGQTTLISRVGWIVGIISALSTVASILISNIK